MTAPLATQPDNETSYEQKTAWVYLLNLIFYFIPLYFIRDQWLNITIAVALLIPFIYGYFWAYRSHRDKAIYPISLMLLTAICVAPFSSGALSLFSFASFFIAFFYPVKITVIAFLALSALIATLDYVIGYRQYYFTVFGIGICLTVGLLGFIERNKQQIKRQQQRSQDEITQLATALERERIGRDLHDILGHQLASIALKAELSAKLIDAQQYQQAKTQISQVSDITRESLSQIRQAVSNFKHEGLQHKVIDLSNTLRDKSIEVTLTGQFPQLPALIESQLALIMTEVVNNMLKHSKATQCTICSCETNGQYTLSVTENVAADPFVDGNGITGIKERASMIGATMTTSTNPAVSISLSIPRNNSAEEATTA